MLYVKYISIKLRREGRTPNCMVLPAQVLLWKRRNLDYLVQVSADEKRRGNLWQLGKEAKTENVKRELKQTESQYHRL